MNKCIDFVPQCGTITMLIEREKEIMTLFDVTVDNRDTMFKETFRIFATCKREAMMKGIRMARLCDEVKGELFAIAKVVR